MTSPDFNSELPNPWYWTDQDLSGQLYKEVQWGHVLFKKAVKTLARRQDCDDVLFEVVGGGFKYAVVHLTWAGRQVKAECPSTLLCKDWNDVWENVILKDSEEFNL